MENKTTNLSIGGKNRSISDKVLYHYALGIDAYAVNNYSLAVSEFSKAIDSDDFDNQNLYIMRGTAYEDMGNDKNAKLDFMQALKIDKQNSLAEYRLAMLYYRDQDINIAIYHLENAYANCSKFNLEHVWVGKNNIFYVAPKVMANNLGSFLGQVGNHVAGLKYADIAISLDESYHAAYLTKGLLYCSMQQIEEGIKWLNIAIQKGNKKAAVILSNISNDSTQI